MRIKHLRWIYQGNGRLCLARFYFDDDRAKLSVSICWKPQDFWIGAYWERDIDISYKLYICLLPMIPLRFHWKRSHGGKFG